MKLKEFCDWVKAGNKAAVFELHIIVEQIEERDAQLKVCVDALRDIKRNFTECGYEVYKKGSGKKCVDTAKEALEKVGVVE